MTTETYTDRPDAAAEPTTGFATGRTPTNADGPTLADTPGSTPANAPRRTPAPAWPMERVLFAMAGTFTLASAILAATVSPWFLLLTGFVGTNQLLYVTVRNCGASLILRRVFKLQSAIYPER